MENLGNLLLARRAGDGNEALLEEASALLETASSIRDDLDEIQGVEIHPTEEEEVRAADDFLVDLLHGGSDSRGTGSCGHVAPGDSLDAGGCVVM
jgi:hypothetical protein